MLSVVCAYAAGWKGEGGGAPQCNGRITQKFIMHNE